MKKYFESEQDYASFCKLIDKKLSKLNDSIRKMKGATSLIDLKASAIYAHKTFIWFEDNKILMAANVINGCFHFYTKPQYNWIDWGEFKIPSLLDNNICKPLFNERVLYIAKSAFNRYKGVITTDCDRDNETKTIYKTLDLCLDAILPSQRTNEHDEIEYMRSKIDILYNS